MEAGVRLTGKVALITGAAHGIGHGIARRFLREGAEVVIADIDDVAGPAAAEAMAALGTCLFIATDVSRREQVVNAVALARSEFGRLDVLVNDAIALSPYVPLEQKTDEMLARVLGVGLWGTWWAMQAAFPVMRDLGGGRIINFNSVDADAGAWLRGDYNVTKAAIGGLTRSAAAEWARFGIRVNEIAPVAKGTVYEQLVAADPQLDAMLAKTIPVGYCGDPEDDIAPAAVFLASDDSRYITGETLHVDGGMHLARYQSQPPDLDSLGR
jgi:NAD(P)-dependent dehydrogenase (short-subunit alcohol dehydrogenase family)